MKRRNFLKSTLQAAGGFYFSNLSGCQGNTGDKSPIDQTLFPKIVLAKNNNIRDAHDNLIGEKVASLLSRGMESLFQFDSAEKCWQRLFNKDDVVGIKINCLAGRGISTHNELVEAIVEGVKSAGVPERNIIIWDRANRDLEKAGYSIQTDRNKLKCYGNDWTGYTSELYEFGEVGSSLSNILVKQCTAIINVPILKDHGIVGVTNAMKNFFGAIHNPNKYHENCGDPFVADVNMLSEIRSKTRLTISDVLTAQCEGGPPFMPQWAWNYNGLLIGFDRVAIDALGWTIIEEKRSEQNLPLLKQAGREPAYIARAADEFHKLGTNDLNRVEIIQV